MTPENWVRVKEVLGAALELPESERAAFLDETCGSDTALRAEVERLLAAHLSQSLESPVAASPELIPGQTLSHYRIESSLGRGGMGAVYKAHDEKLQRPVALKVLSGRRFDSPAARQRFLREARAASALNHPHIVTVYEAGSEEGLDYIAMEYVEGKTLDRLIPPKGLLLPQALDWAITIAGALAKAHAAGIVHRDLKPANIMVTRDGQPKLLDFGLARRVHHPGPETATLTLEGEIFGTPAYMSPEQAEGKTADKRSDIFSFGVVLYEMLSGRRAFKGNSTAAILGAVLKDEPPPLTGVPAELVNLITRCLRKDPTRRLHHIDDVKLVLEDLKKSTTEAAPGPMHHSPRQRMILWTGVAAVVLAGAGFAVWRGFAPARNEMRIVSLTNYPGSERYPSFSPDGSQVAFSWNGENQSNYDVYVKVVGSTAAPLRLTSNAAADYFPAWSPDGREIAFLRYYGEQAEVRLISPLGGAERKLADLRFTLTPWPWDLALAMNWSPDGKWLALSERPREGTWGLSLLSVEHRERRAVTSNVSGIDYAPAFSPDGRYLAYASCVDRYAMACDSYLLELDPERKPRGQPRRLTRQNAHILGLTWSADGESVIYAACWCVAGRSPLWQVAIAGGKPPARLELPGPDVRYPAVSRSAHRLAYMLAIEDSDIWMYQTGNPAQGLLASTAPEENPQFSPDGSKVAFGSKSSEGCREIWVANQDGTGAVQLTNGVGRYQGTPRWSPDGRWIAFDSMGEDGHTHIYVVEATGGQPRLLTPGPYYESVPSWSRDGAWVYFRSDRSGRNEVWKAPFGGGEARQATNNGGYVAFESWDGATLYFLKLQGGVGQPLYAMPVAGGEEREIIARVLAGAFYPMEEGIYYIGPGEKLGGRPLLQLHDFTTGRSRTLTEIEQSLSLGLTVSPDRKTVLFTVQKPPTADLMLIENFR